MAATWQRQRDEDGEGLKKKRGLWQAVGPSADTKAIASPCWKRIVPLSLHDHGRVKRKRVSRASLKPESRLRKGAERSGAELRADGEDNGFTGQSWRMRPVVASVYTTWPTVVLVGITAENKGEPGQPTT